MRVFSANLPGDIRNEVDRGVRGADTDINRAGERVGARMEEGFNRRIGGSVERGLRNDINRSRPGIRNLFGKLGGDLGGDLMGEFRTGIGAGRPGPVVVSALALAGPAILNSAAAIGTAAAGALTAAFSSVLLTGGLLFAAFKSGADSIKPGVTAYKELGKSFGVAVADGMAGGFNTSATILRDGLLTPLYPILSRTGELLGNMFTNIAKTITIPENVARIGSILTTNQHFIDRFDTGLQGLTSAFLTLFAASKPMIDLVGDKFAEFGQWAASALSAAEANGTLATVMDKLTQLASGLFDWLAKLGPAFGNWLLNLDPAKILEGFALFGQILSEIGQLFSQISSGAGPHFHEILANIRDILKNIVDSGVLPAFADHVGQILDKFTDLVATLSNNPIVAKILAIATGFALFGGFLAPVFAIVKSLGGVIDTLAGSLGGLAAPILAVAAVLIAAYAASQDFRNAVNDLVTAVGAKLMPIWDQLQPKLQALWDNLVKLADAIGQRLAPIIVALTPVILNLIDVIGSVLGYVISQLSEFVGFLADVLTGDFEGAWEHLKNMFSNLFTFLGDIFTKIRLLLGSIWTGIVDLIYQALLSIGNRILMWADDVWNWITSVWNNILGFFVMIWGAIVAAAHFLFDPWVAFFEQLWTNISNTAVAVWNAIWGFLVGIWNAITGSIMAAGNAIQSAWNATLQWISDTTSNVWNWIAGTTAAIWGGIWGFLSGLWNAITGGIIAAGNAIQSAWDASLNWIASTTSAIWDGITGFLSSVWDGILGIASSIWNAISQSITDIVASLADILGGWWDAISGAVSDAWGGLEGVVSGIWNAIKDAIVQPIADAWSAVTGWISQITSAVSSAVDFVTSKVGEANDKLGQVVAAQTAANAAASAFPVGGAAPLGPVNAQLARGGVVLATPGGINAVVGEGRNNERIEPLDSQGLSRRDRALIGQIVSTMVSQSGQGAGPVQVRVMIGDRELTDVMTQVVQASNNALARRIAQRKHA